MTAPAYGAADGPRPAAARGPDPGEVAVRRALVIAAESVALAVAELAAARPGDAAALEMARLTLGVLENLGEAARGRVLAEAVLEQKLATAFEQGRAFRPRLSMIPGGR